MTTTLTPAANRTNGALAGAVGGLVAAAAFVFGIALLVTSLSDYSDPDATPAESVEFLVENQGMLQLWYFVIFIVFGVAIIPLARSLHRLVADANPVLADLGAVFAYIWAGLMFATGMTFNIGSQAIADRHETDPAAAETLWSVVSVIVDGLGGGNELVGGMWILLVSLAAWGTGRLPKGLNVLGVISAAAGLVTLVPGLSDVGIIFGLGSIGWLAWAGIALLRGEPAGAPGAAR